MTQSTPPPDPTPAWTGAPSGQAGLVIAAGAVLGAVGAVAVAVAGDFAHHGADAAWVAGAVGGAGLVWRRRSAVWLLGAVMPVLAAAPLVLRSWTGAVAVAAVAVCSAGWWLLGRRPTALPSLRPPGPVRPYVLGAVSVATIASVVYGVFAVERHQRFGSGSWDYGCYLHNAWLFAHGDAFSLQARSAVLGDVAFWGGTNHFMPSLVITAPLAWLMEGTDNSAWLIIAQNVVVAAAAIPLALLARRRGLGPLTSLALVVAWCFHVGVQSALLFDVHEIALVPLALLLLLLLVEEPPNRWRVVGVAVLAALMAGTKESAWLYLVGVGAVLVVGRPGWRRMGIGVGVAGLAGFVVVVGVIQPGLLEGGSTGMVHAARFPGVGDTPAKSLGEAAASMLWHPGRTVALLLTPSTKVATVTTLSAGFAHLALASWEGLALALPNLAERLLSDKREMWGTAFHYSLVTAACLAWGALHTIGRLHRRRRLPDAIMAAVVVAGVVVSFATASRPPDLAHFEQPYFASAATVARYRQALRHIDDHDAVVAQNHFLPHVALRRHIWLPESRFIQRADAVILDTAASPWPHTANHVAKLVANLEHDPVFHVVFHEGTTWVFRRHAAVPPPS